MNATLILGASPRVAVPIARSLSAHNIPVICSGFGPHQRRITSRAIKRFAWFPHMEPTSADLLKEITQLIVSEGVDYLMPCTDAALAYLAHNYDALARLAKPACPPPEVIARVLDKELTLQFARDCGVPVPRSLDAKDLITPACLGSDTFPLVVKPRGKSKASMFKVRYVENPSALRTMAQDTPGLLEHCLVQEYCAGDGVGLEFLIHQGKPQIVFQHRRITEHPRSGGASVVAVSEFPDPALAGLALRLLLRMGWEGVAMVEFRHDRTSGRAVLMEVNGRYWGSLGLSRVCGVDFPYAQWLFDHGELPPRTTAAIGVRARWTAGVVANLAAACQAFTLGGFLTELRRAIPDLSPAARDMVFAARDPVPAIQEVADMALQETKTILKHTASRLLPEPLRWDLAATRRHGWRLARLLRRRRARRRTNRVTLPSPARNVLFVCHGNIIRSPLAEHLFKRGWPAEHGLAVQSAGLRADAGKAADPRAVEAAASLLDVDLSCHRAQQITSALVTAADLVLLMDRQNEVEFFKRFPEADSKTFLLAELSEYGQQGEFEIADPYEGTADDVRVCFQRLSGCISDALTMLRKAQATGIVAPRWPTTYDIHRSN